MKANQFRAAWEASGDQLYRYPADAISASSLPEHTKRFLVATGLPQEAAPFLSFGPGTLDWLRKPGDDLGGFYALGSDGSGNPLAVDEDGFVWLIEHERPCLRTLVNSSVLALAECLLAYRNLVTAAVGVGGDDAVLDGHVPQDIVEAFSRSVDDVDSEVNDPSTFWGQELSRLLAEATD